MFDKLGKKSLAIPLAWALVLCCILSIAIGPILRADPRGVQFAIVNLDEGAVSVTGNLNVGQTLTDNLLSGEASLTGTSSDEASSSTSTTDLSTALSWQQMSSEEELMEALANNEVYGGIVIPANFTSQQVSSAVGLGDAPELSIYLNKGKNAQLASSMQTTLASAMLQAGIAANFHMVNDADVGGGMMSSSVAVQMMVMPLFMMTMVGSIFLSMLFWKNDVTGLRQKNRWLAALVQIVLMAGLSAAVAGCALFIDIIAGGMSLPALDLFLFLWFGSFSVMMCFNGVCNLCFPVGALLAVSVFTLGMSTAMLPAEMLPQFWADWIYPWAPQAHLGQGIRSIIYLGQMPIGTNMTALGTYAIVGLIAMIIGAAIKPRSAKLAGQQTSTPQPSVTIIQEA